MGTRGKAATWGNIMCDLVFTGLPGLPVMGEELFASCLTLSVGGGAALTALGMSRLGWDAACIGRVGRDFMGRFAADRLRAGGVDTSHLLLFGSEDEPGNVTVAMSFPDDRAFVTHQPPGPWNPEGIPLASFRHHHFAGYEGRQHIIRDLGQMDVTVSLDTGWGESPGWREEVLDILPHVDVFLPNEHEALYLADTGEVADALDFLGQRCPLVAIKLGPRGVVALWQGVGLYRPGFEIDPVDTTGAGDAFDAGFLDAWLRGLPLPDCLVWGNACGALAASGAGSDNSFQDAGEVAEMIRRAEGWDEATSLT